MKTLIVIPSMNDVPIEFAISLACLQKPGEVAIQTNVGSLVYESRNKLAMDAIKGSYDCVMWFDSDMAFPADTLQKMLKHIEDGYDMVSGVYVRRAPPFTPVLFKKLALDENGNCHWEGYDEFPEKDLFEIDGCGFGCVCMKTSVLINVFSTFGNAFCPIGNTGEDVAFCCRAKACGYKIMCDPTIPLDHCGRQRFNMEFYKAYRK